MCAPNGMAGPSPVPLLISALMVSLLGWVSSMPTALFNVYSLSWPLYTLWNSTTLPASLSKFYTLFLRAHCLIRQALFLYLGGRFLDIIIITFCTHAWTTIKLQIMPSADKIEKPRQLPHDCSSLWVPGCLNPGTHFSLWAQNSWSLWGSFQISFTVLDLKPEKGSSCWFLRCPQGKFYIALIQCTSRLFKANLFAICSPWHQLFKSTLPDEIVKFSHLHLPLVSHCRYGWKQPAFILYLELWTTLIFLPVDIHRTLFQFPEKSQKMVKWYIKNCQH